MLNGNNFSFIAKNGVLSKTINITFKFVQLFDKSHKTRYEYYLSVSKNSLCN